MKKCRTGILLLAAVILLLGCTGCFRRNKDKDKENGVTTTHDSTSLIPTPNVTLPGEDGETTPQMSETTAPTQEATTTKKTETTTVSETATTTTKVSETTTKAPETTTKKTETTTKAPETTTTKQETTTKAPETTTKKTETTTTVPETTTTKQETTTKAPETTTKQETTTKTPETTANPETTTKMPETTVTEPAPGADNNGQTTAPEIGAGEWLHFEDFRDHHAGAVAYLGQSAAEMPIADLIAYFGLPLTEQEITVIDHGEGRGDTWYLILPRYRDTMVRIREAEQTGKRRTRAGELIAEGMHPMLIRCEGDEALAEIYVELIHKDETISFPLKAGGDFHERVLDITPKEARR